MPDGQTKQARAADLLPALRHSNVEHTAAPPSRAQTLGPSLTNGTPPELIPVVEGAVRRVLNQHGLSAFAMPREAAIAHEVGHAIVGTHEGLTIKRVTVFSRATPPLGLAWGGFCKEAGGTWTAGPTTSADDDLRRARMIIAGLAAETITGLAKPGSSLDEVALSQLLALHVAVKLDGAGGRSNDEHHAHARRFWRERVWNVALAILHNNREPFTQLAEHLHHKGKVQGGKLRKILSQVKRAETIPRAAA